MRILGASASHVGQVRDSNQDRALFDATLGAVADGMGGHAGGERAAAMAIAQLSEVRGVLTEQDLIALVATANRRIYEAALEPSLRGMGTTLVAAGFDPTAGVMTLVNVGDSRGYLLRDDALQQITVDHSLVEDLIREGQLTDEEARSHPQRNIVTRALGINHEVDVDAFAVIVRPGDRILLASDGLSNEVDRVEIAAILGRSVTPQEACDDLVEAALAGGGRDNVTVVVLDVHDDPVGGDAGVETTNGVEVDDGDARRRVDADGDARHRVDADGDGAVGGTDGPPAATDEHPDPIEVSRPRRRRFAWRSLGLLLSVLVVLGVASGGTVWYAQSGYFADEVDGSVAIFRGRPDGVLWFKPVEEQVTDVRVEDLDGASQERLERRPVWSNLADAQEFVDNLDVVTDTGS